MSRESARLVTLPFVLFASWCPVVSVNQGVALANERNFYEKKKSEMTRVNWLCTHSHNVMIL